MGSAQKNLPHLPEDGVKRVVSLFPNENMDVSTSLWEAESIEMPDHYLRDKVGNAGKESYYQINEANAIGLIFLVFFPYTN